MKQANINRYPLSMISFILSILFSIIIFKFLYYKVNVKVIPFSSFEIISLLLSLIPLLFGVIGLFRDEKMYILSITGIVVSVLTAHELISMAITSMV